MKSTLFKFLLLLLPLGFQAQELLPFVENFTKSEYHGDNQNWNIVQGQDNAMYFANNHYLLRYNGVKWEKYTLPNKTIIRAVASIGDKIYCGSYKEFGYWERSHGKMEYHSLTKGKNLFYGRSANEEVWKIFKKDNHIYFQSFNVVFVYDGKNIEQVTFPYQISYCYPIDDDLYVATVRNGIYKMIGKQFVKMQNWSAVDGNVVHHIEKHDGKVYVFTKTQGVFEEEASGQLVPWKSLINNNLKEEIIVTAKFLKNNKLAIGTGLQGLYLIDLADGSFQNIKRENAIKNNAVLTMAIDREDNLWLGLDNGIAHVEINSSIEVFMDNSGILGSVYALSPIDDGYLFVTNHGVFIYRDGRLQGIPNSQGQVWDIYKLDGQYIIGHNDGTYIYDGSTIKKINNVNGGWKFFKSKFENVYFQANYAGIAYYTNGDLSHDRYFDGFKKPIRNIAQNKPGELWAADNYRSLYRITYDENFKTQKISNVSQENGIANDFGVKIFSYKNEILFLIDKTWYTFNEISGKLEKDVIFNNSFRNISDIIPVDDQNFMILNAGLLYLITQIGDQFKWELIPEKYYEGKLIIEDSRVFKDKSKILLNLDDGFLAYEFNKGNYISPKKIVVEGFVQGNLISSDQAIKFNQSVEINIVTGLYGYNHFDLFYRLNNSDDYIRIRKGSMVLNNLKSGEQQIEFYEFTGKEYHKVANYHFDVQNPWYFSLWMILIYILVIAMSFFLYYRWNKFRYTQKMQLREEELRHQRQILEMELKAENEHNVQEYEKHILELEIQTKSSEVTGKSLSIAKQSEMIENIQQILESESDLAKLKNEIRKAIKINEINKHEWETFEVNLNQMNNEFILKLTNKYPNLTSKDIKLCVFLKMNLSSKEIAPMMNISFRGVELHRYRLRKKLALSSDENLSKFMLSI